MRNNILRASCAIDRRSNILNVSSVIHMQGDVMSAVLLTGAAEV
jgi:hypothetical protein